MFAPGEYIFKTEIQGLVHLKKSIVLFGFFFQELLK